MSDDAIRDGIALVSAWTNRDTPGLPSLAALVVQILAEHDPGDLIEAEAKIASGILAGVEMAVDQMLQDQTLLVTALAHTVQGRPLKARHIGLDRNAVLHRIGRSAATD